MTPLESPIEWKFAVAVREFLRNRRDAYYMLELPPSDFATFMARWDADRIYGRACAPQVEFDFGRVDFLFAGYCFEEATTLVVVECDGHDFHERTKEQAARDKARDRALAALGIHVMRFTGSEVHRNVVGCVLEVIRCIDARSDEAFDRRHPDIGAWIEDRVAKRAPCSTAACARCLPWGSIRR